MTLEGAAHALRVGEVASDDAVKRLVTEQNEVALSLRASRL